MAGKVRIAGRILADLKPSDRARLFAVVGQSDQPDRRIRVRDYVHLGRIPVATRNAAEERARVQAALDHVGLSGLAGRELGTLSGGERQRAQIARALAQEPKILFLDEPTNHLDPRARASLLALVADLDLTVVAILHDLHLVPAFATKVAILDQGRMVAHGAVDDALNGDIVRTVFGIDLLRLPHPFEDRDIVVFDTPNSRNIGAHHR